MRWSQASVTPIMSRTTTRRVVRSTTGFGSSAPTASSAAWGGLITPEKLDTPYMPRFETVNVPPDSSGGVMLPSRTFCGELA